MSIEAEISERAREIAEAMRGRRSGLAKKKADLEAELSQINAEISTKDDIDERLAAFKIKIGDDYQCPYCGMYDRTQRPLSPIGSDAEDPELAGDVDVYRCHTCDSRYSGGEEKGPSP